MSTALVRRLLVALALVAAPGAHAQFVQCTEGTGTPIGGSVIAIDLESGNVVFPTATVSCGQAAPALTATITQPSAPVSTFAGGTVNFQWTIGNFNPSTDQCSMSTQPNLPGTTWNLQTVTPSSPGQPFQATIPSGTAPGNYGFRLLCNRNGTVAAVSEVTITVQAQPQCAGGAPILPGLNPIPMTWAQLFPGSPFGFPGQSLPYPGFRLNSQVNNPTTSIDMLTMQIVAPATSGEYTYGSLSQNLDNGQPFMFFSKCPGDMTWPVGRTGCAVQGTKLSWKVTGTNPSLFRCNLDPGETYYFNLVFIDRGMAQQSGIVKDICNTSGATSYSSQCSWLGGPQFNSIDPVTE